jgi:hypothetical protein
MQPRSAGGIGRAVGRIGDEAVETALAGILGQEHGACFQIHCGPLHGSKRPVTGLLR